MGVVPDISRGKRLFATFPFLPDSPRRIELVRTEQNFGVGIAHIPSPPELSLRANILSVNRTRFAFCACGYPDGIQCKFISGFATERGGKIVLQTGEVETDEELRGFIGSPVWEQDRQGVVGIITGAENGIAYMTGGAELLIILGIR